MNARLPYCLLKPQYSAHIALYYFMQSLRRDLSHWERSDWRQLANQEDC